MSKLPQLNTPEVKEKRDQMAERYSNRVEATKEVIAQMEEHQLWDQIQARDLDPKLIEMVSEMVMKGIQPGKICDLLNIKGGKNGKNWRKILAYFRQGFRGDAELYLYKETQKFYKTIEKAKDILDDAFENGTPQVDPESGQVTYVKGATKELATFMKAYAECISLPVKLWKDYGAIGEKSDGNKSVQILVQSMVQLPSPDEIKAHQDAMIQKMKEATAIPVESTHVENA